MQAAHGALALTILGVAIGLLGWWQQPSVSVANNPSAPAPLLNTSAAQPLAVVPVAPDYSALKTFRGAAVDGQLRTDFKGRLVIDMQLRHWIDFHLSAQGEVPLAEIVALMQQQMQQLPQPGQQQALQLLDDYLGYLQALAGYDAEAARRLVQPGMDDLEARLLWQQRLRREWLQPLVVEAFFGAEEQLDQHTLASRRLRRDGASPEALAALEQTLPEPLQQMRQESRQLLQLRQQEQQLSQSNDPGALQQWREQQFGPEAAGRLADLDKQHQQWQQRLQAYQAYRDSLALQGLNEADRERLLATYQRKHFSAAEQKRLPAALSLLAADNSD